MTNYLCKCNGNGLLVSAGLVTVSVFILTRSWSNSNTISTDKGHISAVDWSRIEPESMTGRQMLHYFAWTNQLSCGLSHDFGGVILQEPDAIDGQKAVCLDKEVEFDKTCTVYSFGINDEWSFDEAMEKIGCTVFSFDPSMNMTDHYHSDFIIFYKAGLSDRDQDAGKNGWKMRTLSTIFDRLWAQHTDIIDYLKIDIEGDEWDVIPHIIQSGMLSKIRQLGIEIHLNTRLNYTLQEIRNFVRITQSLERNGMVRFDSKRNPWSGSCMKAFGFCQDMCYELAWYNSALLQQRS